MVSDKYESVTYNYLIMARCTRRGAGAETEDPEHEGRRRVVWEVLVPVFAG